MNFCKWAIYRAPAGICERELKWFEMVRFILTFLGDRLHLSNPSLLIF
jgi:hypothetical protein